MEAYQVKYKIKVKVVDDNVNTPPSSLPVKKGDIITIERLDGMYCNAIDCKGNKVYIAAWTQVEFI